MQNVQPSDVSSPQQGDKYSQSAQSPASPLSTPAAQPTYDMPYAPPPPVESVPQKHKGRGCMSNCIGCSCFILLLVIAFLAIVVGIIAVQYDTWVKESSTKYNAIVRSQEPYEEAVQEELDERLAAFNESGVQKEVITLDCDMMGLLLEDRIISKMGGVQDMGLVCDERAMTLYLQHSDYLWSTVYIWQKAEGEPSFAVYDVKVGPYSLAQWSFGYVTAQLNEGIQDALDLALSDAFSGRKIGEIYITEEGVRIVGVLQD